MKLGPNYWKLWSASVVSNLGDGVAVVAYPWLASLITRDGFKLGLVVLAGRLPWLLFSLPAGVITDRVDRRRIMVWMDILRAVLTAGVVLVILANQVELNSFASDQVPLPNETVLLVVLIVATFLFGMAEVLRDNSGQTLMPALVDQTVLEKANGRMWAAEMVMNQFVGPPLGGFLLGVGLAVPFYLHTGSFVVSAVLLMLIVGQFRARTVSDVEQPRASFWADLKEGFAWLWSHPVLRPLAIALGTLNASSTMAMTTYVLFAQEVLGLEATAFGILLTAGAVGGVVGSLMAARIASRFSKGTALFLSMTVFGMTTIVIGLTSSAVLVWLMGAFATLFVMVWNVITVSLRQRIIPDYLLGRVNSVYRFFGWGMMSIGALLGGAMVSLSDPSVGREWSLRLPFLIAGGVQLLMLFYAVPRFNSQKIADSESAATAPAS